MSLGNEKWKVYPAQIDRAFGMVVNVYFDFFYYNIKTTTDEYGRISWNYVIYKTDNWKK